MTIASEQSGGTEKLSATSEKILELREDVFAEWEKRVRAAVSQASNLRQPILIDTLPAFYDNLAQSVTPAYPRLNAVSASTVATEHGGERARLTNFDPKAIILEYQLLRGALLDVLASRGVALDDTELQIINASIENAIRESVTAYVFAATALREQFMAALMHDLRGPLGAANLAAQAIARTPDGPKVKAMADIILRNHSRIDEMLHHLLDTMVFQGGGRLRLNLSGFDLRELVESVREQAQEAHRARLEITGESALVTWSREEITRALENLIANAVKYGDADTPITLKIDPIGGRVMLSVHNHGNPIAVEEIEDIFQFYQRARAAAQGKKEGWGIGLSFVRAVAESHGGSVTVDSSLERGTTFLIDIPSDARPFQDAPTLA